MSDEPIDPVDPELGLLFQEERARGHAPASSKERAFQRLAQTIGASGGPDGGNDPSGSPGGAGPDTASSGGSGAIAGAGQEASRVAGAALATSRLAPVIGAFFAGGIAGGIAVATWIPPRVVVVENSVRDEATPTAHVVTAPSATVTVPVSHVEALPPVQPLAAQSSSAAHERDLVRDAALAREKTLLDVARTALGRGDGAHALAAVERHTKEFPRGRMREEREALAIQSLMKLGRRAEAAERGLRFQQTYPNSVLAPVVDAALASLGEVRALDAGAEK